MTETKSDYGMDTLLELNGVIMVIDPANQHWVKFVVHRVPYTEERPHGLSYSLTLHDGKGERLLGFDNAHAISEKRGSSRVMTARHDHTHKMRTIKPYEYINAADLLADFWDEVDQVMKERGITT